jgi:hypothetical protein
VAKKTNTSVVTDAELVDRYDRGERPADIARSVGLSKARIDQRLKRNDRSGPNRNALPGPEVILAAALTAYGMDELATALELTANGLDLAVTKHGLRGKVLDGLQSNRVARSAQARLVNQQSYVKRLRAAALEVQHTPTQDELEARDVYAARLAELFGSAPAAMLAAGLIPNERGRPPAPLPADFGDDTTPTADDSQLADRASRLILAGALGEPPAGNETPQSRTVTTTAYYRDPAVVAWVLQQAAGRCEACGALGYETDNGTLFLEVHHLVPIADGGPDIVANAVAICETCHGKLHRWIERVKLLDSLRRRISRIGPLP